MNIQDFNKKNRAAMVERIAEKKQIQEQYLEEAFTLSDVSAAYEEYRKIKKSKDATPEEIQHARSHMYYISRKYRQYRESLGKKAETDIEKKINYELKESYEWVPVENMDELERQKEVDILRSRLPDIDVPYEKDLVRERIQDLTAANGECAPESLELCEKENVMNVFNEEKQIDKCYGIPSQKKYPLYDEKHVKSAIRLFGHCEPRFERHLALAIIAKMRKYHIPFSVVGADNRLQNYLPANAKHLTEGVEIYETLPDPTEEEMEFLEVCALYEELSDLSNCEFVTEGAILNGIKAAGKWIADKAVKVGGKIASVGKAAVSTIAAHPVSAAIGGGLALAAGAGAAALTHHLKKKKEKKAALTESIISVLECLDDSTLDLLTDYELVEQFKQEHELYRWKDPNGEFHNYHTPEERDALVKKWNEEHPEKKSLTEAVTFVDNAGKVKTTSAEDYVKSMHEYDTDTQIPFYKKDRNKMYKLLTEDGHLSKDMTVEEVAKKHNVSVEELEKQVKMGIEVEHEHTSDNKEAKRIALDHLYEFPDYYTRLDKMEEEGEKALEESVLDPVQKERCKEIFDDNDKMLPEVKKQIVDRFMDWKNSLEEKFTVDQIVMIGSSTGFQYTPTSDVDITVISHDYTDEIWDKVKETMPNGNNLEGTEHPVNYFIRQDLEERKAENIYDVQKDEWIKKSKKAIVDIHMPYVVEMSRFFMNAFDLTLKEYERDKQDYLRVKELDPEKVEISEEEKADALSNKLTELKADLDALRMGNHVLRGFLHEAYEEEDGMFEVHIEIKSGDDPRLSINNLVYKLLERYGYREKIDSTIKDAEELIEAAETEMNEKITEILEEILKDDNDSILLESITGLSSREKHAWKLLLWSLRHLDHQTIDKILELLGKKDMVDLPLANKVDFICGRLIHLPPEEKQNILNSREITYALERIGDYNNARKSAKAGMAASGIAGGATTLSMVGPAVGIASMGMVPLGALTIIAAGLAGGIAGLVANACRKRRNENAMKAELKSVEFSAKSALIKSLKNTIKK